MRWVLKRLGVFLDGLIWGLGFIIVLKVLKDWI